MNKFEKEVRIIQIEYELKYKNKLTKRRLEVFQNFKKLYDIFQTCYSVPMNSFVYKDFRSLEDFNE